MLSLRFKFKATIIIHLQNNIIQRQDRSLEMPVYTYRCENCGVQFDESQKFVDPPMVKCPECGKKTLRKVFQPVGIVFKGSGFYSTDHRSSSGMSYAASAKADKAEGEKSTSDKSSSTDFSTKSETSTKSDSSTPAPKPEKKEAAPSTK
jgi:putative FmdB family regulatory protein